MALAEAIPPRMSGLRFVETGLAGLAKRSPILDDLLILHGLAFVERRQAYLWGIRRIRRRYGHHETEDRKTREQ